MSALATRTSTRVLGRYTTPEGARTLYGRYEATEHQTRITDESAAIKGDIFLVEICPDGDGPDAIEALVSDYILCRRRHRTYYADRVSMLNGSGKMRHIPRF